MESASLTFDKGSILVKGEISVPYAIWDDRVHAFRVQALYYKELIEYFKLSNLSIKDDVQDVVPCPHLTSKIILRNYQKDALNAWDRSGKRGVVVLPTGAGKTIVAVKAIELINYATIIVVPTLDLVEQWKSKLEVEFKVEVGVYGGGDRILKALTVSTYDSAYLRASELGNKFSLIIFDEVHHLPAGGYRLIAEMFTAPYRMGLTATLEREDMLHTELPRLTGGVVYSRTPNDLTGRYLSEYTLQRIAVDLTVEERAIYTKHHNIYRNFLTRRRIKLSTPADFQKFIMRSGWDKDARRALLARNHASNIAFNSEEKIKALENILISNPNDRILIFTQHNQLVYRISKRFLLPYITHDTEKEERRDTLTRFKDGRLRTLVTSKVLDEGIDVPEASIGVVLSGTGSSREFIQRLGRLLRKVEGKQAKLIEIVSKETSETKTSIRRKRNLSNSG